MDRYLVIQAAYFAVIAIGETPSQRTVQEMTKSICGKAFQTKDVLAFLSSKRIEKSVAAKIRADNVATGVSSSPVALQLQQESGPVAPSVLKIDDPVALLDDLSSAHARVVKVLELEEPTELLLEANASSLAAPNLLFAVPDVTTSPARHSKRPQPDRSWVEPLRREARLLRSLTLGELDARGRYTFARYFAFKFRGAVANENGNRKLAVSMLSQVHDLGRSREIGRLTVDEYVADMEVLRKNTGAVFLHSPWAIKGALEYGAAAVGGA